MTLRFLQDNLWPTITKLARKSDRKHVAVAYLGQGANKLLPLDKGDSLVIDMSQGAVKSGQTDPKEIEKYLKKGVDIYTCTNLHAKVYIFDKTLVVGSANVSRHSRHSLIEAGLLCRDRDMLTQARGFVKSLQVEPVTPGYVKLCKKRYRTPKIHDFKNRHPDTRLPHSRLWVIGTVPTNFSGQENRLCWDGEKKASKKLKNARKFEVNSICWPGKSRLTEHVMEGDLIVSIHTEGKSIKVFPPSRVLLTKKYRSFDHQKQPRMFIHIEEPKNPKLLGWRNVKDAVVKAGLRSISSNSIREIRSSELKHVILGLWS